MTAEQRYWQAIKKARIQNKRNMRRWLEGKDDMVEYVGELERSALIKELARAYEAGRASALTTPLHGITE